MSTLADQIARHIDQSLAAGIGSAAAVQVRHRGLVVAEHAAGTLLRYGADGQELGANHRPPADRETWFDLASVTKVVSTITVLTLVNQGLLDLDEPIARYLPTYRGTSEPGRNEVTTRHLLTHTSGLPGVWSGWRAPLAAYREQHRDQVLAGWPGDDRAGLVASLLTVPLNHRPGTHWEYSCVGYNTAMLVAESATGTPWAQLVHSSVMEPLGLLGRMSFGADPIHCAATEVEPDLGRGLVWGQVHDESSWSLGGACANAGLFGTADAVADLGEAIRTASLDLDVDLMWRNALPDLLGRELADPDESPWGHSLGLRIGQRAWMGREGEHSRGHTGFTGTSVQIDRDAEVTIAVLTNRVHPTRDGDAGHQLRAAVADTVMDWVGANTND